MSDLTHILCWDPYSNAMATVYDIDEVIVWLNNQSKLGSLYYQARASKALCRLDLCSLDNWIQANHNRDNTFPFRTIHEVIVLKFNTSDAVEFKLMFPWLVCDCKPQHRIEVDPILE